MKTKILNLIELIGHSEVCLILVDPAFDLNKNNDEICEHESCRSSYNAWAIASETLEKIEEIKQNGKS